ncbi:MAG: GIDE domain-containing protein, partial [Planctomycetota bacterium]
EKDEGLGTDTFVDDRQSVPCLVEDETGSCEVDPLRAEMELHRGGKLRAGPHRASELSKRYGKSLSESMDITETVLQQEDQVYVLGTACEGDAGRMLVTWRTGFLFVSNKSESELLTGLWTGSWRFCLIAVLLWAAPAIPAYFALRTGWEGRLVRKTPTTPVADIRPGLVEVKGKVRALAEPLKSPVLGTPCVHYHLEVTGDDSHGGTDTIIDDSRSVPFLLEDETGACKVDLPRARLALQESRRLGWGTAVRALSTRYDEDLDRSMDFAVTLLRPGDQVYVLGTAREEAGRMLLDDRGGALVVSDKSESELLDGLESEKQGSWAVVIAIALAAAGAIVYGLSRGRTVPGGPAGRAPLPT